jgi:ribosomal protein S18 acetylase RimI-like enzyme
MPDTGIQVRIRTLEEMDIASVIRIDERITGIYRPDFWEQRVLYYLRRDPEGCRVAEVDGKVVGFMMGDLRAGEFGIEEPSGWIERFGIDPDHRGRDLGKRLFEALAQHFRERGAVSMRTLVDAGVPGVAGFLRAMGFASSTLEALEMKL